MNMNRHDTTTMWSRGIAAVALATLLATIALNPVRAQAQPDGAADQPNNNPAPQQQQPQIDPNWIQFRSGTVSIGESRGADLQQKLTALADLDASHILVQLDGPVTDRDRRALREAGIELQTFLSSNAFFASIAEGESFDPVRASAVASVRSVAAIQDAWKLHDFLAAGGIPTWAIVDQEYLDARIEASQLETDGKVPFEPVVPEDPIVGLYVSFHPDVTLMPGAWMTVLEHGGTTKSFLRSINSLVVELPYSQIDALAAHDSVMFIEPALPAFVELNNSNRARVGADTLQQAPYGLNGAGVVVFVYDGGGALASHADFGGRVTQIDTDGISDHATHVAGTIGGDGTASSGLYRGMAPAVTILSAGFEQPGGLMQGFLYTDPGDLEDDYGLAIQTHGAVIANNSIGTNTATNGFPCDWTGNYGNTSALIDAVVRGSLGAPIRVVWANGNERQSTRCLGVEGFQSPYHSTAPPACAKNHITVGALNSNDDSITSFTSFGPTDDGRIKPDVSAPGCQSDDDFDVTSTSSSGGYTGKCGTSMASPTVCGVGALCIQAHRQSARGSADMLPSTLKAILANTAEDLGRPGPDYEYGHGSVRGIAAVDLIQGGHYREGSLSQGEAYNAVVIVGPGDNELRITLAWDDAPAAPLVIPSLVNDLDLAIFDAGGTRHYPYILDPQNPTANATTTTENRLDNIEQIVIQNPAPGAYRVEVTGFSVPQGPQNFSLAATPTLLTCSSAGFASIGNSKYSCTATANLQVIDCDLNTDDLIVDTVDVTVISDTEPGGEVVTLTEIDPASATFAGTIELSETDGPGILHISPGDDLTMTYIDADDGMGGSNIAVESFAIVDCTVPTLIATSAIEINPRDATINVQVDEPAQITLNYGTACGSLTNSKSGVSFQSSQDITIVELQDDTTYFYNVEMTDQAGNSTVDDNGGSCYQFTTPQIPDFFTEQFGGGFDMSGRAVELTPDLNVDQYVACQREICVLPSDPFGGTMLQGGDNVSRQVILTGGQTVKLYGQSYSSFFVGSNGYVTFTTSDTDSTESLNDHFDTPRISMLFDDLDNTENGFMSAQQLADRAVVTWYQVPQDGAGDSNTFQLEMFFDGRIVMNWLEINPGIDCIIGLSEGQGIDVDFFESDFTVFDSCGPQPPQAANVFAEVPSNLPVPVALNGCDTDGGGPLDFVIQSLPTYEIRDAGNDAVIDSVPYTLINNGNEVIYQSSGGFIGLDSFDYAVDDGGTPPDGGQSDTATATINVLPVLALPFSDDFESPAARGAGFDTLKWHVIDGVEITQNGINPPSPPNVANFNGSPDGSDELTSHLINLSTHDLVNVSYYYQQTGAGESPDSGDDLFVEYLNDSGAWVQLAMYLGSGPDMTNFVFAEHTLSADALHAGFRLRFRNTATSGNFDDWLVDDVVVMSLNAPAANDVNVATSIGSPISITLDASDPNGDPLDYIIQSLPDNGSLRDPDNNALITTVPYTLLGGGDAVIYAPAAGFNGIDSFTYFVDDGEFTSNIANVGIDVGGPQPIYSFPLDSDPGWSTQGDWAFGVPAGNDGDPSSGFTGANVYGFNLDGDYPNNMANTLYVTTTALDLTDVTDVTLQFRRWLGIEASVFDKANIQVSNDGSIWTTIWQHNGPTINETSWSFQEIDISAVADDQATVFIRWGMGPTDGSVTFQGWNLDDIEIWGRPPADVVIGDTNGDGIVDIFDLLNVLKRWGACPGCPEDFDGNGVVDIFDLLTVLKNWTGTKPLSAPMLGGDVHRHDVRNEQAQVADDDVLLGEVFINDGVLVPADHGGYFDVRQHFRQTANGELGIELAGRLPVERADILVVPDHAQLDGKLTVWLADDFVPAPGDTFTVVVAGEIEGEFSDVLLPDLSELLGSDARFELVYTRSTVTLYVPGAAAAEQPAPNADKSRRSRGDLDGNGRIDVDDVLMLIHAWGPAPRSSADLNGDDVVDSQDLAILLQAPIGPRQSAMEEEVRK